MLQNELTTEQIQDLDTNHVVHPWEAMGKVGKEKRTVIERGEGVYVYDTDGNRLIDGPAGMWCVQVGHGREELGNAMAAQASTLAYYSPWSIATTPAAELAEKLAKYAPGDLTHVHFTGSGSASVDSAVRFAQHYFQATGKPNKQKVLARYYAYHGSTFLGAALGGKPGEKDNMSYAEDVVIRLSAPNPYRRPDDQTVEIFCDSLIQELEETIAREGADNIAAYIAEPILASGGVVVPPKGYNKRMADVCRKHGILVIHDEVVTAFGRLGYMFASEEVFDVVPDLITMAKGLTSGYVPLGAVMISDKLIQDLKKVESYFNNGFTYSGHPVACAAALENIRIMEDEEMLDNARDVGAYFQEQLRSLEDLPIVGEVRGMGLMGCVEIVADKDSGDLFPEEIEASKWIDQHCEKLGLIVRPVYNMLVMSPPLIITRAQVDDLVGILRKGIELTIEDLHKAGHLNWAA